MSAATIEENRRKAVEHLRTTKRKQGFGSLYNHETRCYCALGHMGLAVGIDAKKAYKDLEAPDAYGQIEDAFGLDGDLENAIFGLNDDAEASLREIGDYLANVWEIA